MSRTVGVAVFLLLSAALFASSWQKWITIEPLEAIAFITGAACVWLTVEENIWNWPIGIANSAFFLVLFLEKRLFADGSLQLIYIILGVLGWYLWLRGGKDKTELKIERTSAPHALVLMALGIGATWGMAIYLRSINDAAPFLDALTTVLSLVAQYMLTRKHLENWLVWMTADIIYIYLYASRTLYLTAVLYAIFFGMCVAGLLRWKRTHLALVETAHG